MNIERLLKIWSCLEGKKARGVVKTPSTTLMELMMAANGVLDKLKLDKVTLHSMGKPMLCLMSQLTPSS